MSKPETSSPRRRVLAALGLGGAAAATLQMLPGQPSDQPVAAAPTPRQAPEKGGGYRLTEHVKQYYKTTLV